MNTHYDENAESAKITQKLIDAKQKARIRDLENEVSELRRLLHQDRNPEQPTTDSLLPTE